jgi:hypothetical protein
MVAMCDLYSLFQQMIGMSAEQTADSLVEKSSIVPSGSIPPGSLPEAGWDVAAERK